MIKYPLKILYFVFLGLLLAGCGQAAAQPPTLTPQEVKGQALFKSACSSCHSTLPDEVIVGPSQFSLATRAGERVPRLDAEAYIRQSILDPRAYIVDGYDGNLMPITFGEVFSPEELDAVVAYLLTLK